MALESCEVEQNSWSSTVHTNLTTQKVSLEHDHAR